MEMKIAYNNRNPYEAPEAEVLIVRFEGNILDSPHRRRHRPAEGPAA